MNQSPATILMACPPWARAFHIQQQTIQDFHQACTQTLGGQVTLLPLQPEQLSLERNLFSTLFIMAAEAAGVDPERLPFFAMIYQCLRGQVTGCDNLLDDEYKGVIPFDLPGGGIRFRSVLTIMTSDMVLAKHVLNELGAEHMDKQLAKKVLNEVLALLIPSGIEEHEEESHLTQQIPTVETVLEQIHPRKTGSLFSTPVRLAQRLNATDPERSKHIAKALADFGIGCQILDDLKDVADDLTRQHHNIVISQAFHGEDPHERRLLQEYLQAPDPAAAKAVAGQLESARTRSIRTAINYFQGAEQAFCRYLPEFSIKETAALGLLVQKSIMQERNDLLKENQP